MYKIYYLSEKRSGEIFYIGRTKLLLKNRLSCHLSAAKIENNPKDKRIRAIIRKGSKVLITEVCRTNSYSRSFLLENFWSQKAMDEGCKILNLNVLRSVPKTAPKRLFLKCG